MVIGWLFAELGICILSFVLLITVIFLGYLLITNAFKNMGFTSGEAFLLVFASFIFGFSIFNIYLFTYRNWSIELNIGGALIPILLSMYLMIRKKISLAKILVGISLVSILTYFVTFPDPKSGIVSVFPFWLIPAFFASLFSVFASWKNFRKAAPLAYISGTIGVLIGADILHLYELLSYRLDEKVVAAIGGANILDMVFITGILAVTIDGILMFRQKKKEKLQS